MTNLPSVTLQNGQVIDSGTVSTIDGLIATQATQITTQTTALNTALTTLNTTLAAQRPDLDVLVGAIMALGQTTMAASTPVVIASDQAGAGFDFVCRSPANMSAASSGNQANAICTCATASAANKRTYLSSLIMTASGSTSGLAVTATIIGQAGTTIEIPFTFPIGALVSAQPVIINFVPPLVSSANNTAFVVTLPAGGSGNTHASVSTVVFVQ